MTPLVQSSSRKHPQGFTLIELIVVIGLFGIVSSVLMSSLLSVYHFRDVIRYKKNLNFEASSVLNNGIPGLIRSGFAINYDQTNSESIPARIFYPPHDSPLVIFNAEKPFNHSLPQLRQPDDFE